MAGPATFRCLSSVGLLPVGALAALAMLAFYVGLAVESAAVLVVAAITLGGAISLALRKTRVVVGADGVTVAWLFRSRFVPFDAIASVTASNSAVAGHDSSLVERVETRVHVRLLEGETITLTTAAVAVPPMGRADVDGADVSEPTRRALVRAIRDGLRAERATETSVLEGALASLAPNADGAAAWVRELRALGDRVGASGYRAAELPPETLWRVVEHPAAPRYARAGAALALRGTLDAEGRARVRRVTEETASPKLRVALEAVAAEDDAVDLVDVFAPLVEERAEDER